MPTPTYLTRLSRCFCLGALLLSGCSEAVAPAMEPTDFVSPGKFNVGHRITSHTYTPAGTTEARTIRLVVWYPTLETAGEQPLFRTGNVYLDAAPAPDEQFPVMVFSHGTTAFAEVAHPLSEHMASHGFVVVAPDHVGDTTENINDSRQTEIYLERPQDISASLDWAYGLDASDPLAGRLTDDVVVSGHSFGGFTVLLASGAQFPEGVLDSCTSPGGSGFCSNMTPENREGLAAGFLDERIDAVMAYAPGNAHELAPDGVASITMPVLHMSASHDQRTPNETNGDLYWEALNTSEALRVNFETGGHHSFVITCAVLPATGEGDGCGEGFVDWREAHRIMNTYSLAFARYHLFVDESAQGYLDGTEEVAPDLSLSFR